MPEPLTDERLAELERLCAEATPGPWRVRHLCSGCGPDDDEGAGLGLEIEGPPQPWHEGQFARAADAKFIAAARDALPAMIAEVRALREENAALRWLAKVVETSETWLKSKSGLQPKAILAALDKWRRVRGE